MSLMKNFILFSIVFLIGSFYAKAQLKKIDVASISQYCEASSNLDPKQLADSSWVKPIHKTFKIIKNNSSVWVKFNSKDLNHTPCYLLSPNPNLDLLEVYVNDTLLERTGDKVPFKYRQISDAYPTIKIGKLKVDADIMVKLSMDEDFIIPLELHSEGSYHNLISRRNTLVGMYVGIMAAILIYNLMLFLSIKNRLLLYYCFYVLFVALTQLSIYSNYSNLLFPNNLFLLERDVYLFSSMLGIACAPFIIQLLKLNKYRGFKGIVQGFVSLYSITLLLSFSSRLAFTIQLLSLSNLLSSLFILCLGIYLLKRVPITKYFLLAWSIFLIGAVIFILVNYYILPYKTFIFHLMPIGTAIEAMLLSLALGYRVNLLVKDNKRKDQIIKEKDEIIAKLNRHTKHSELMHLNGHMQPHFLFNAVTSVQNYIQKNERDRAVHYLARYSKLMRHNLEIANKEWVSLEEELDFITNYIEMESLRLEIPLKYNMEYKLESEIDEISIPPMIIQPIVENCFKHAFKPEIGEGVLRLIFIEDEDFLVIKVIDNGVGFSPSKQFGSNHKSYALRNINKRIHYYNEKDQTLKYAIHYNSIPMQETIFKLTLPIEIS